MAAFWKPGTLAPGSTIDRASETEGSLAATSRNANSQLGLTGQRQRLPIYKQRMLLNYKDARCRLMLDFEDLACFICWNGFLS